MNPNSLYQDLVQDFKLQKKLIDEQINTFEPLTASLRKPGAQRLLNKGALILFELLFYLVAVGAVAVAIMMKHLVPFYLLEIFKTKAFENGLSTVDVNTLFWTVTGLLALIGILFFYAARLLRKIRLKNTVIHTVNKHMKTLLSQHMQRKTAIDAIEKKHFTELPTIDNTHDDINDIPNPGY